MHLVISTRPSDIIEAKKKAKVEAAALGTDSETPLLYSHDNEEQGVKTQTVDAVP